MSGPILYGSFLLGGGGGVGVDSIYFSETQRREKNRLLLDKDPLYRLVGIVSAPQTGIRYDVFISTFLRNPARL
jgi:hypothetical protein